MTDDRPYYSTYLKSDKIFTYLGQPRNIIEEWGFLLILVILLESIIFAAAIIVIPLVGRFRDLLSGQALAHREQRRQVVVGERPTCLVAASGPPSLAARNRRICHRTATQRRRSQSGANRGLG